jgi:DNA-binding GntR family transcriptional regulator
MSLLLILFEESALIKEKLAARLCSDILQAHIKPGERIVKGTWARRFGVEDRL